MEQNKKTLKYKIVYGTLYAVSLLPFSLLYALSDFAYLFVSRFYRRKVVRSQLAECFPEMSEAERREVERKFYHQFCDNFVEIVKQLSMSKEEMMQRITFSGLEDVLPKFSDDNPLLMLYLGHYANWEWIASMRYWTGRVTTCQVYHPLYNKEFDQLFIHLREQYGGESIPMKQSVRRLIQLRREGTYAICGMIADQLPKWEAIHHFSPFLNHDSAVFIGTEQVAKKLDTMVYYGSMRKLRRGYYDCHFVRLTDSSRDYPDYELTDQYMQLLEADIRRAPELWLWTHKRWRRTKAEWEERQRQKETTNS